MLLLFFMKACEFVHVHLLLTSLVIVGCFWFPVLCDLVDSLFSCFMICLNVRLTDWFFGCCMFAFSVFCALLFVSLVVWLDWGFVGPVFVWIQLPLFPFCSSESVSAIWFCWCLVPSFFPSLYLPSSFTISCLSFLLLVFLWLLQSSRSCFYVACVVSRFLSFLSCHLSLCLSVLFSAFFAVLRPISMLFPSSIALFLLLFQVCLRFLSIVSFIFM